MLAALITLLFGIAALWVLDLLAVRIGNENAYLDWLGERIAIPLARIGLLLAFLSVGYPDIFSLANPPPLSQVLTAESQRVSHLINFAFLAGLLLPVLPVLNRFPAPTVSLQAVLAATLLYSWTAEAMRVEVALFPGFDTLLIFIGLAVGGYWLCRAVLQGYFKKDSGMVTALLDTCLILTQAPAIWFYAGRLGQSGP